MAAVDFLTLVVSGNTVRQKRSPSTGLTPDFISVRIGESNLEIKETAGHFDFSAKRLTNLAAPTADSDAATKTYVDALVQGLSWKDSVVAATTAALPAVTYDNGDSGAGATLTADANGALPAQDGVTLTQGQRLLVKNQAAALQNGIYTVTAVGDESNPFVLTRTVDADTALKITAAAVMIEQGSTLADTKWTMNTDGVTMGTTGLTWAQFSGAGDIVAGAGLTKTGSTLDVVAADDSIQVNADSIQAKLDPAGAISVEASVGLQVNVDNTTIEIDTNALRVRANSISETHLTTSVAGAGLAGGNGTALSVNTGDGTKILSDAVVADYAQTLTNDNAGAITVRQVVYVKANGNVDLARADVTDLDQFALGLVEDASIAASAAGKVTIRRGAVVGGFTGLTPGHLVYVDRSTAGALTQSLSGFVAGEHVYSAGRALSATQVIFDPQYVLQY